MRISAHRGASGDFPENTLAAFRGALSAGCAEIECDVRQTKDGVLVLSHDPDLKRTSGSNAVIGRLTYEELRTFDVGSWFDARFSGERMPRFTDLLDLLPAGLLLHIDIKQDAPPYEGLEVNLLETIKNRAGWQERTTFASANVESLERLIALKGGLRIGYQTRATPIGEAFAIAERLKAESFRINIDRLTPDWVRSAHEKGIEVYVYSANTPEDFERMNSVKVDLVFSSFPDKVGPA